MSVLFGDLLSHSYNITFSMFLYLVLFNCPSIICTVVGYEVGMAESPSIATVVSAMLGCDLVSILFGDLT